MASKSSQANSQQSAPRIYLATPPLSDPAQLLTLIPPLLVAHDVAALLVRLVPADDRTMTSRIKALAPAIQQAGTAVLIDGHTELIARAGADGVHVSGIEAMQDALPLTKSGRMVGVGGLHTRHDAMVAGEAGADYVLFGEPDNHGQRPSADAIYDRLQWWAEVFEPPCVGYAMTLDEAGLFARAGADFILVSDLVWNDSRGPSEALAEIGAIAARCHAEVFGMSNAMQGQTRT